MTEQTTTEPAPIGAPAPAASGGGLFRKQAQAQLDAGEQLDTLLSITTPRLWLVLGTCLVVIVAALVWMFAGSADATVPATGILLPSQGILNVSSTTAGVVSDLPYAVGVQVSAQERIATVMTGSGSQVPVETLVAGTIVAQFVTTGTYVAAGQPIAELFPMGSPISGVVFVAAESGKSVAVGMTVDVSPSTAPSAEYGTIVGHVASVSPLPVSNEALQQLVGDRPGVLGKVQALGPVLEVVVTLQRDETTPSGYHWTAGNGPPFPITPGTLLTCQVVLAPLHPSQVAF